MVIYVVHSFVTCDVNTYTRLKNDKNCTCCFFVVFIWRLKEIYYTPRKRSCGGIKRSLCPSVRPSQSLIRYSSKTAEQNFMKLSGIVHYMMPYCTSYFKFLFNDFGVGQSKTRTLPYKTWGSGGYHFVSIAHSISSFYMHFTYLPRAYMLYCIGFQLCPDIWLIHLAYS